MPLAGVCFLPHFHAGQLEFLQSLFIPYKKGDPMDFPRPRFLPLLRPERKCYLLNRGNDVFGSSFD